MPRTVSATAFLILIAATLAFIFVQTSQAGSSVIVTLETDPTMDGCATNGCSLREAVAQANGDGSTIEIPDGTDVVLTQGEIMVTGGFGIIGQDASVSGNNNSRIFNVAASGDLYILGLTILNGRSGSDCGAGVLNDGQADFERVSIRNNVSEGKGGGICNNGTMDLEESEVSSNSAKGDPAGGGILNTGELIVTTSEISNNTATGANGGGDGAGLANTDTGTLTVMHTLIEENTGSSTSCDDCSSGSGVDNDGEVTIEYSWISNNHGDSAAGLQSSGDATVRRSLFSGNEAGAILNSTGGTMLISNTTISGNLGAPYPKAGVGGVTNYGQLSIVNATITNNTGLQFSIGGVNNGGPTGSVDYKSTIMSNNGPKNCGTTGSHHSNGYNVFDDDTCDSTGSDQTDTDPLLGPLQDNGGPTWSNYLQAGSPAINAGGPGCPTPDQLGALRVGGCDSGAVEYGGVVPTPSPTPSPTPAPVTYQMGDADCTDTITTGDVREELLLAGGLSQPDFCGRTGGCAGAASVCNPAWTDPNCDGIIDARDALWIVLHLAGHTPTPSGGCWAIGTYPN